MSLLKKEAALYALQPPDSKRPRLLHGVGDTAAFIPLRSNTILMSVRLPMLIENGCKPNYLMEQVMVMRSDGGFTLEEPDAAAAQLGVTPHTVRFESYF